MAALEAAHSAAAAKVQSLDVRDSAIAAEAAAKPGLAPRVAAWFGGGGNVAASAPPSDDLLDFAFVTFYNSELKDEVLKHASELGAKLGCTIVAAPHPGDVAWRNLEATDEERRKSSFFFMCFMVPAALLISTTFSFFCTLIPLLNASPILFEPWDTYLVRLGYFAVISIIFAVSLNSLLQPLFAAFVGRQGTHDAASR